MSIAVHTIDLVPNSQLTQSDRIILGLQAGVANVAGSVAGAAVITAVSFASASLPTNYVVLVTPGQDATAYVSAKTSTGFNVTLVPRQATATLSASTFDVLVLA